MQRSSRARARAAGLGHPRHESARSPPFPSSHARTLAHSPRFTCWGLLVGLVLLCLGLYWYGTALPHATSNHQPSNLHNYKLLPFQLLTSSFSGRQRYLRRTAAPLSVCKPAAAMPSTSAALTRESYSIWAMPKGKLGDQLRGEISHLADQHGGPRFPPHLTVLGDIELPREEAQSIMKVLAAQVKKYRINFVEVTRGTFFYQCVFLKVAKDEGTMAAAAMARSLFDMTTPPYMPHLSLLYADLDDVEKAQVVEYETSRLYEKSSGRDTLLVDTGYDVATLALWYTPTDDKTTQSWCLVEEYPLS